MLFSTLVFTHCDILLAFFGQQLYTELNIGFN